LLEKRLCRYLATEINGIDLVHKTTKPGSQ